MELLVELRTVVSDLLRDRFSAQAETAEVRPSHPLLPTLLLLLERVLAHGLHEGNVWWDCWSHALGVLADDDVGLPDGIWETVGHNAASSRAWLANALAHPLSLLELITRLSEDEARSVVQAYYTPSAIVADATTPEYLQLQKALGKLSSLTFRFDPKSAALWESEEERRRSAEAASAAAAAEAAAAAAAALSSPKASLCSSPRAGVAASAVSAEAEAEAEVESAEEASQDAAEAESKAEAARRHVPHPVDAELKQRASEVDALLDASRAALPAAAAVAAAEAEAAAAAAAAAAAEEAAATPAQPSVAVQTDSRDDEVSVVDLERRLNDVQRLEMDLVHVQLSVKDREMRLHKKERLTEQSALLEDDLLAIKEMLVALVDVLPADRTMVNISACNPSVVRTKDLGSRLGVMLGAMGIGAAAGAPGGGASFAAAPAGSGREGSVELPEGGEFTGLVSDMPYHDNQRRARSCALAPGGGGAQVVRGFGKDATLNLEEDFFAVGSDDDETVGDLGAMPILNETFCKNPTWLRFEGYNLDEVGDVKREAQLALQSNRCAGCNAVLPSARLWRKKARLCNYTGKFFCSTCHKGHQHVIPSLVINRWDFGPKRVCDAAHWHLRKLHTAPLLRLRELNPKILSIPQIEAVAPYRAALVEVMNMIRDANPGSGGADGAGAGAAALQLPANLSHHAHCLDTSETYSLKDLCALSGSDGAFLGDMRALLDLAVSKAERINTNRVTAIVRAHCLSSDT